VIFLRTYLALLGRAESLVANGGVNNPQNPPIPTDATGYFTAFASLGGCRRIAEDE